MSQGVIIVQSLASLPVAVFQVDLDGHLVAANAAFRALALGGEAPAACTPPWANAHPSDRAVAEATWQTARRDRSDLHLAFRVWHRDGRLRWVRVSAAPVRDSSARVVGFAGVALDDTDSVADRALLDRLLGVLDPASNGVLVLDRSGTPVYANGAARRLLGADHLDDLERDAGVRILLQDMRDQVPRELLTASTSVQWSAEATFRGRGGTERLLEVDIVIHRDDQGVIEYWGAVICDVTDRNRVEADLLHQATHDGLTGLPNRVLLLRTTADELERLRGTRRQIALLFLDVDRLKDVNDKAGHEVGDALLGLVAQRVVHVTRPSDVVARIGGDEFVVLCRGSIEEHDALDLAERIRNALTGVTVVRGVEVDLTVSVGVALSTPALLDTEPGDAALTLLNHADAAMYTAKRRGRSRVEMYTDALRDHGSEQRRLAAELERALADDQLVLDYQPIVSTLTGHATGAEALLRWEHPARGRLMPADFLHLAEESGAIVPIGEWVLDRACRDTSAWMAAGLVADDFGIHVNVSGRQLQDDTFVERVLAILRANRLSPGQLTLDLRETTIDESQSSAVRAAQALRRFGVRLAVDDFGAGVSSLTALRRCGARLLKLDGSVARDVGSTGDDPVVRAIIQLAHALDMQVVAEWVTSADQLQRLRLLGCDLVQGHLLGAPAGAEVFASRMSADRS